MHALRHPMIEKLLPTHYVPNDIYLGTTETECAAGGMLLFGTNSSGKSSLMKSVGLCVIMAQSGLFVPCDAMTYYPYLNILTRITGEDNFSKGFSSFVVEMVELRTILVRSTPRSLVLGDEICHGTEQTSALAIVASSLVELAHKQCNFIFATHLHALCAMPAIVALLPQVKCWHLKVTYDEAADALVYNRKLAPGGGSSLYGLEVAKYIIQDHPEFIERCLELRKKIMDVPTQAVSTRTSKYNAKLVVDKCKICGKHADDTHHINFQCTADETGCIDAADTVGPGVKFHKHTLANLVTLCKICHLKVHHSVGRKKFVIHGYEQTSKGTVLRWNEIEA
jgi:DNA mismatch repair protein MutS